MSYQVDPVRQAIADSWPNSLNIEAAQKSGASKQNMI